MTMNAPDTRPSNTSYTVTLHRSIAEIAADQWDRLNPDQHPFLSHAFFSALEESGSIGGDSGWDIHHLSASDDDGNIIAIAPHFLKYHSYGEYVFDHSWANAYERAGGRYYPKSLIAVPFTPVPGPRLLCDPQQSKAGFALIQALQTLCENHHLSSAHVNFITAEDEDRLSAAGWSVRSGLQFHWHNQNYTDFTDFLSSLSSRKRKNIKKERASLNALGIDFETVTGPALTAAHMDAFYQFYMATIEKKWGGAYLTHAFFRQIANTMADQILLVLARRDGEMIAGALNFIGKDTLYGRNWGCSEEVPNLHFETCYYQAIDFAIKHKLARVEAGAQGIHKVQRGYVPVETKSAHFIPHEGFRASIERFLIQETQHVAMEAEAIMAESPYRRD